MRKLKGILTLVLLMALLASPIAVLASDISDAKYYGTIIVSNNGTATNYVSVNCTINTQALIDGGYLNSSANNCVVRNSAGADLPFMPAANASYPWCIWVPSIGQDAHLANILYTANSTGGEIRYFPADEGMSTADSASLELGDNFTIEQKGWVDTSYSSNKTLVHKERVFKTFVNQTGNITSSINYWLSPTGTNDPGGAWSTDDNIRDDDTTTQANTTVGVAAGVWSAYIEATHAGTEIIEVRMFTDLTDTFFSLVDIDIESGGWQNLYHGSFTDDTWLIVSTNVTRTITKARFRFFNDDVNPHSPSLYEVVFDTTDISVTATGISSGVHTIRTEQGSDATSWWDNDWAAKQILTFDNSASSENLTSFPVLVYLDNSNFDFDKAQSNGEDIRFINQADNAELDYEIENWDATGEEAWIWVEVPQIDAGSITDFIYMYFANSDAADGQDVTGTWNANYMMVQHLSDNTTNTTLDSTNNDNDGKKKAVNEPVEVDGSIYKAQRNDGTDDFIDVTDDATLDFGAATDFTLMSWVNVGTTAASDDNSGLLCKKSGYFAQGYSLHITSIAAGSFRAALHAEDGAANQVQFTSTEGQDTGSYFLLAATFDRNGNAILYWFGAQTGSKTIAMAAVGDIDAAVDLQLGEANNRHIEADIDESRISDTIRSAEWLEATYLTLTDTLITYGSEEINGLRIYIDSVLQDLSGSATVSDNAIPWAFLQNNVMPYMEYHTISVNGTQVQYIDWEYDDTTFQDSSAYDNDATPTFRTASSDADVSAVLSSFLPIAEAKAPAYALAEALDFIDADALTGNVTARFTTTPYVPPAGGFPLAGVITAIATATDTPPQLPLLIIAIFIILAASLTVSATMRGYGSGSLIPKIIAITAVMGVFIGIGNFGIDFWMLFVFLVIAIALSMGSKQVGWQ